MKYRVMTSYNGEYMLEMRPWWLPVWKYVTSYSLKDKAIEDAKRLTERSKFKPVQVWP